MEVLTTDLHNLNISKINNFKNICQITTYSSNYINNLSKYKKKLTPLITKIINANCSKYTHECTLLGNNSPENIYNLTIAHNIRQKHMKEGIIAQIMIGNFIDWEDLGIGHPSGLDCRKIDNSIIMEIKNKYNTCNSSSQKTLLDKLSKYKKNNPDTICVWGIINSKPNYKKLQEIIIHNDEKILKIQGSELLKLIFTINDENYSHDIIKFIKNIMYK